MKPKKKAYLWSGISVLIILALSYIVNVSYTDENGSSITTRLLGILIFYNKFVLAVYILIALFFIWKGIGKKIKFK